MEAKSALSTEEIKTPSQCSRYTTESGGTEGGASKKNCDSASDTATSSGDEYQISRLENSSGGESGSTEAGDSEDFSHVNSEEYTDKEEESFDSEQTTDAEEEWEPDDSNSADSNSATDTNSEVRPLLELLSPFSMHESLANCLVP